MELEGVLADLEVTCPFTKTNVHVGLWGSLCMLFPDSVERKPKLMPFSIQVILDRAYILAVSFRYGCDDTLAL